MGTEHVARICAEVDDCIWWPGDIRTFVAGEVEVRCQGIEDLAAVGQVGFECEDASFGVWEVGEVEVEDLIAALDELGNDVAAGFS